VPDAQPLQGIFYEPDMKEGNGPWAMVSWRTAAGNLGRQPGVVKAAVRTDGPDDGI